MGAKFNPQMTDDWKRPIAIGREISRMSEVADNARQKKTNVGLSMVEQGE